MPLILVESGFHWAQTQVLAKCEPLKTLVNNIQKVNERCHCSIL